MIHMRIWGVLFALLISFGVSAQRTTSLKLNEVLVINEDNFQDDYGKKSPWIEIYNNSAGTVDIAACYLTDDPNNPKKYMIPKGDVLTKIRPRQHTLFWADNNPSHGTFHLNFTFDPTKDNYLALYDSDGRTLIDEVVIPASQKADVSYGLSQDGSGDWITFNKVTPSTNNITLDSNAKIDNFKENDPSGVGMTVTAMAVVFCGLCVLFLVFKLVGKIAIALSKKRAEMAAKAAGEVQIADVSEASGEVFAAIATALHEAAEDVHDIEDTVLTIERVQRTYSPWSSKIYTLRKNPRN